MDMASSLSNTIHPAFSKGLARVVRLLEVDGAYLRQQLAGGGLVGLTIEVISINRIRGRMPCAVTPFRD
jgi:hypothetical protein